MWLQEIFILGKQSLCVGLYCNNHPSQHKLNTSFSIWQFLSSQFLGLIYVQHLNVRCWMNAYVLEAYITAIKSPFSWSGPKNPPPIGLLPWATDGPARCLWHVQVPRASFYDIHPSPPRFHYHPLPRNICLTCSLAPVLPWAFPKGNAISGVMTSPSHFFLLKYPCT